MKEFELVNVDSSFLNKNTSFLLNPKLTNSYINSKMSNIFWSGMLIKDQNPSPHLEVLMFGVQ